MLNSLSTRSQENFKSNLINNIKGEYSNTFYKPHRNEFSKINEIYITNKKNKLLSANYVNLYKNNESDKNSKIKYIRLMNNNIVRNKSSLDMLKSEERKKIFKYKENYSMSQSQKEFPQVYNNYNEKKINDNITMNSLNKYNGNNKRKLFNINDNNGIYPYTQNQRSKIKYNVNKNQIIYRNKVNNKYFINYYGGKIHLIEKKNNSISNNKYDYVPWKLLCNPKHKKECI